LVSAGGQCGTHPGVTEPHHPFAQGLRKLRPSLGLDRHASAAPLAGLINLHPLHSIPFHFRRLQFHSIAFRRPQTAETVKDSGAPKDSRGRDAPHIGQDQQ
jgi:hypothetical protein